VTWPGSFRFPCRPGWDWSARACNAKLTTRPSAWSGCSTGTVNHRGEVTHPVGDQWPAGGRRGQQCVERLVKLRVIGDVKTRANLGTDCYKIVPYS
jgi:hypothetical protein